MSRTGAVLVTGFGPFAEVTRNPSGAIAEALAAEPGVVCEVLPVAYAGAAARIERLLDEVRPSAWLLFGVHRGPGFLLERVALNLDDEASPDIDGSVRRGVPIQPGAPVAYWSTLPLPQLAATLERLGLAWRWSSHAGGFLCNHSFYVARHLGAQRGRPIPCGLIHVPPLQDLPLATQVIAGRACLDALCDALPEPGLSRGPGAPRG